MQILFYTDHHIEGDQAQAAQVDRVVENALSRFSNQITRVEVHLNDVNSFKGGQNDKRCVMEASLEGLLPIAVTHQAATIDQAIDGAVDKLTRLIESTLGRIHNRQSRRAVPPPSDTTVTPQS